MESTYLEEEAKVEQNDMDKSSSDIIIH